MFVQERQNEIVKKVNRDGSVRVKDLSECFQVTEDCIRKDLTLLEKQGLLKKAYGGAVKIKANPHLYKSSDRKSLPHQKEREIIAKKAISLIHEDDTIFLDVSLSCLELAKLLVNEKKHVTVVTNMIDILSVLSHSQHDLIFIGGELNQEKDGFCGSLSIDLLKRFKIDKAFLGVVGIDMTKQQLSTYHIDDGMMKATVIEQSQLIYILSESKKIDEYGNYIYASLKEIDGIVLDEKVEEMKSLEDEGIHVY